MLHNFLFNRVRFFNKRFLNRVMIKIAGASLSPIAVVRHTGRRSGKRYQTPIIVEPVRDGFVFALTYGTGVDWYHNILAAGECTLGWHGKEYALEKPALLDVNKAFLAFPMPFRPLLQIMGIRDFFEMKHKDLS